MERLDDSALNIFTDGSMYERPRRGGYAFIFVTTSEDGSERVDEFSPDGVAGANSQEMEHRAVLEALQRAASSRSPVDLSLLSKIVIHTDSTTVHDSFNKAKFEWSKNKWMRRSGPPVLYAQMWKEIVRLVKRLPVPVHIEWVKGKSSRHTKLVDKLAKESAQRPYGRESHGVTRTVRRKRTEAKVDPGSVAVEGQIIDIQLVTVEYYPVQKTLRYRYEVVDEDSPYFGLADYVFSDETLETRWVWRVRFNDDPKFAQIAEVIEKVGPASRSAGSSA